MSNFMPPEQGPPTAAQPPVVPPAAPPGPPSVPPGPFPPRPRKPRSFWGRAILVMGVLFLAGSVVLNVVLATVVAADIPFMSRRALRRHVIRDGKANQVVAMLEINGVINAEDVATVRAFCHEVAGNSRVKAVLLRVDSPGGGVSVCDRIYNQFKQFTEHSGKPMVVSMGGVAASGGYYISAPADAIIAEPTTITGSIGVLGGWAVLKGTMDKIGVKWVIVRSSPARAWKAAPTWFEEPAKYQINEVQKHVDKMHERFETIVRKQRGAKIKPTTATRSYTDGEGKPFTVEESEPFNGRIFLAAQAKKLGLVDDVGYLDDAMDKAAALAGLDKPEVVVYTRRRPRLTPFAFGKAKQLGMELLDQLQTPRLMMLWKVD